MVGKEDFGSCRIAFGGTVSGAESMVSSVDSSCTDSRTQSCPDLGQTNEQSTCYLSCSMRSLLSSL